MQVGAAGTMAVVPPSPTCRHRHARRFVDADLAAVAFNADGLVPAIVQEQGTGAVLMMAWMNEESLRRTLETGRTWFWSRSRQEYWCKGETSGDRQFVREAYYDCDGDTLLLVVEQEGRGACHTGERTCFYRRVRRRPSSGRARDRAGTTSTPWPPATPSCRCGGRWSPTWRRPVAAFLKLVGDGPTPRPASCSSRSSTATAGAGSPSSGRDPSLTLVARDGRHRGRRRGAGRRAPRPGRAGRRRGPARRLPLAGRCPTCPRCTAAWSATWATTWCGRSSACPTPPPDDLGLPDAVLSVIGQLAAFDHWRQRVMPHRERAWSARALPRPTSTGLRRGRGPARRSGRRPRPAPAVRARSPRPTRPTRCPRCARRSARRAYCRRRRGGQGAHPGRRHLPGRAVASASTSTSSADPFDVYRVLRQVNPSPYMYFLRHPAVTVVGSSPEPMVQLRDGEVVSRPIAGTRRRGAHRRGGPPPGRRAAASTPRSWPSTSCSSTWPATTWAGWSASAPRRSTS